MITRTLLILFCLFLKSFAVWGQSTTKTVISVKEFTDNPWPFEPSLTAMQDNYGDYLKMEKYTIKNRFEPSKKDTIIRLFKGKTEIFFYKPLKSNPVFFAANIFDERIILKGDIATGKTTQEFYNKVSYPEVNSDTIQIYLDHSAYKTSLIIRKNKINQIKIEARNKNR